MRFSSGGFGSKSSWCAVLAAAALVLAGCSEDPGLQERLNRLQAEMQEKDRQLGEAQSALEKTKSELKAARAGATKPSASDTSAATAKATPQFLSRDQVEESYAQASKAMQKRVASELRNYSIENCTQFPVMMPTDEAPYHSKIVLSFRSDNGLPYRLEFPVSADPTGKWSFPNSVDIASALADSRQQDQNTSVAGSTTPGAVGSPKVTQTNAANSMTTTRTSASGSPQLIPGSTSTETRVIDWGDGRAPSNKRPTQSPAANTSVPAVQQATPPPNKPPAQTMQSDKDVTIHW